MPSSSHSPPALSQPRATAGLLPVLWLYLLEVFTSVDSFSMCPLSRSTTAVRSEGTVRAGEGRLARTGEPRCCSIFCPGSSSGSSCYKHRGPRASCSLLFSGPRVLRGDLTCTLEHSRLAPSSSGLPPESHPRRGQRLDQISPPMGCRLTADTSSLRCLFYQGHV